MATIKDVAKAAGVSTATVSAVINDSAYVSPDLRSRVLSAVSDLRYAPSQIARSLKRGRSQLIALAVADLANPFYARMVHAAEAAVAAWGYSLVVFNSDEKPENEKRVLARIRMLGCDGAVLVPVGASDQYRARELSEGNADRPARPLARGRAASTRSQSTTAPPAARPPTTCSISATRRIGSITGPLQLSTGRGRYDGMLEAMAARRIAPQPGHIRSGEFREDAAYSAACDLLRQPDRPTALYVANGLMALGVMRAIADLGLRCPEDISIASTDTIAGIGGLRPRLTRAEHPVVDMTNEALRMLVDRIEEKTPVAAAQHRLPARTRGRRQLRPGSPNRSPASGKSLAGLDNPPARAAGSVTEQTQTSLQSRNEMILRRRGRPIGVVVLARGNDRQVFPQGPLDQRGCHPTIKADEPDVAVKTHIRPFDQRIEERMHDRVVEKQLQSLSFGPHRLGQPFPLYEVEHRQVAFLEFSEL